jgi:hypothetical protein
LIGHAAAIPHHASAIGSDFAVVEKTAILGDLIVLRQVERGAPRIAAA